MERFLDNRNWLSVYQEAKETYVDCFAAIADFVNMKLHPYHQQAIFLICGIVCGYLLHIAVFKLRIHYLRKQSNDRNMVVIQSRNGKREAKKNGNGRYFAYIKSAQYQGQRNNK